MSKKNIFNEHTGKFNRNDNMDTLKNAKINAQRAIPRLEVHGKTKNLSNKMISIGRDKSNQLIIADDKVSRFHATVFFKNDTAYIKDIDSLNGTFLNNKQIDAGKNIKLKNGDKIKVGTTVIVFYR